MKTNAPTKQYVKTATIERPTAYIVVGILVEERDGQTIALSAPKILKIILRKPAPALPGVAGHMALLPSSILQLSAQLDKAIPSPYVASFDSIGSGFLIWFSARPPTK